jgi:hypothetical protein
METPNELDKFLTSQFRESYPAPPISLVSEARNRVMARKKSSHEDIFTLLAAFLNYRIRLYHAVIFVALVCGVVLFFTLNKQKQQSPASSLQYVSNIAAVRNSTILPSINTFILRK